MASTKGSRYDRRAFSREVLRACVMAMHEAGFLTVTEAIFRQQRTTVSPTESFRLLVQKHGVTLGDIGRVLGCETIELWAAVPKHQRKERIEYRDTQETERLRAAMETINTHLSSADIRYGGQPLHPVGHLVRKFRAGGVGEPHGFNLHGRLYGGVWETLPKSQRHLLTIDGEELCDLDFSAMFVRLAYCRQGVQPPAGDLYAIPGLAGFRTALKPVVNSLFFRQKEATRLPAEAREALPGDWTMGRVKAAVAALHPAIVPLFDTNVGMELFAAEAEILVAVLLALFAAGITALNMHDGILVAQSKRKYAMETMRRVSFEKTGFVFEVSEKSVIRPLGE
ncbi:hypothetical protein QA648_00440 [Rhizobium sp. CB3171]|uniref:hypothetical protein n=1 Tax=Rhizobium sp. CB3171 TaxID=3039157 RepID=UPI0024B2454E|nr:hypothetical protein [Rhizobium sp. CB3171]WFU02287.1 hypothetical protein QA648_00440 [Rhizobium sp. CB3171]